MEIQLTLCFEPEEVHSELELRLAVAHEVGRILTNYAEEFYRQLALPGVGSVAYTFDLDLAESLRKADKNHAEERQR